MTLKNVAAASLALCAAMPVAAQTLEDFPSPEIKFCYEAIIAGNVFSDLRFMPEEVGNGITYVYPGTDVKFGLLSCFSSILVLNSNPIFKEIPIMYWHDEIFYDAINSETCAQRNIGSDMVKDERIKDQMETTERLLELLENMGSVIKRETSECEELLLKLKARLE